MWIIVVAVLWLASVPPAVAISPWWLFLAASMAPLPTPQVPPKVRIGGPDCKMLSAMSSLSANAVLALNKGVKLGGFAHDAGEGGLSEHHLKSLRVQRFPQSTVRGAVQIMASVGVTGPDQLRPHMRCLRTTPVTVHSYAELCEWLEPGRRGAGRRTGPRPTRTGSLCDESANVSNSSPLVGVVWLG